MASYGHLSYEFYSWYTTATENASFKFLLLKSDQKSLTKPPFSCLLLNSSSSKHSFKYYEELYCTEKLSTNVIKSLYSYFSLKFPSFNFSIISWPSAWVEVNFGIAPLGPKQFLRRRACFGGKYLELRVAWPRTAAAAPDAKSRTPAVGLATVPTIPFPIPVMKPCKRTQNLVLDLPKPWHIKSPKVNYY